MTGGSRTDGCIKTVLSVSKANNLVLLGAKPLRVGPFLVTYSAGRYSAKA